tara:strand:+ start:412 stop:1020 length:609 start_codon:yes stop_codon:yes gene_type:complete
MSKITNVGLHLTESASAISDVAGEGQVWVKSDVPSSLYYTNDAGTDFRAGGITLSTEVATTSGSAILFGSIPTGVKAIDILFKGVSTSAGAPGVMGVTLGDAGGLETAGYIWTIVNQAGSATVSTANFNMFNTYAGETMSAQFQLRRMNTSGQSWCAVSNADAGGTHYNGAGNKTLTGELTQVNIACSAGTFDAGSMNIQFQ